MLLLQCRQALGGLYLVKGKDPNNPAELKVAFSPIQRVAKEKYTPYKPVPYIYLLSPSYLVSVTASTVHARDRPRKLSPRTCSTFLPEKISRQLNCCPSH